ncbi:twin-arginine translocase TatA/TatE family subunit [Salibacteraceae bacterium]|jgi:sec-independent protein translocase protein TatA|nr:twin-arginine translocase TatA/TatE family subunit [Salibacteraceae bacterium]|tara:strand:- start:268 stop:540 length:273 start_codon:yes stop_codon:yes gene_type:complete
MTLKGAFRPFFDDISFMVLLFFSLGGGEIFIILLVILLLFGSKRIPEIARGMGKGIRQFKDATNDIQSDLTDSIKEVKKDIDQTKKELDK